MRPASAQQDIACDVLFVPEVIGDVLDLHPGKPHRSHVADDLLGKDRFVMALAACLPSVRYCVGVVVAGAHPFKVVNVVIELVKVLVIDGPSGYANRSGRLADESERYQLVNAGHPLFAEALEKNQTVALDQYLSKFAAFNASAIGKLSRKASNFAGIANLVDEVKRLSRNGRPCFNHV